MADKKRIVMMGGTAACILATGFLMQGGFGQSQQPMRPTVQIQTAGMAPSVTPGVNGLTTPSQISEVELTAADTELLKKPAMPTGENQVLPQVDAPVATERSVTKPVSVSLTDKAPANPSASSAPREEPKFADQCEMAMGGTEMAGALVKLSLNAPCMPNERVTMHHNGMMFTDTTDAAGKLSLEVPALATTAVFIASFSNGEGAVANVNMTSMDLFDRAVVQSSFVSSVALHALEFGAEYNDSGHIWANAKGEVADAAIGSGGFMTLLGNPAVSNGAMAQVYTFPSGQSEQSGDVALSVEIEVTNANCGLEIEAQSLQVSKGGAPKVQVLDLTMPDCDAVGDFLVLKNLVNDLKVAAN
ncbi:hypothetical protein RXV86_10785 [Alisedimentitalea sp. MJ-SS2]|uniref:hypothetical protein n=1 Tax=Aliisedimentitalea sp. MJ-SS2 TaxID=3049795 RepID=UPI00290D6C4D|nr:hypothetical protein [Alisedimentitalea sp. MJ-SS2]MDU8927868.1 hypothetical protein [Alisedimentitalea sp. MJ-SS2]